MLTGDCREVLKQMPDECVHCCVTSPPYFGLRDYGHDGQIGLEQTPDAYVAELVAVFREVRRVLRDDGTLWLNLGDSYAASRSYQVPDNKNTACNEHHKGAHRVPEGLKQKDLIGIPWRVAFALQADGWYLRQDIIWHKPNPMPESVMDRCTKAHEYVFLLSKSAKYYFDSEAIKEPAVTVGDTRHLRTDKSADARLSPSGRKKNGKPQGETRNRRSVWTVATKPYKGAHFATFPPKLIEPCILAGCPATCCPVCGASACECGSSERIPGIVLDPFGGSGTTAEVATAHGRDVVLIELNPEYVLLQEKRVASVECRK